jgi:hypothetical protein
MSEESKTINIRLKPIFTLAKDTRIGADISDINLSLFKNGAIANCPFKAIGTRDGVALLPCGEGCQHFHFVPETKKISTPVEDGKSKEEVVETGKIFVKLTCGSGSNGNGTFFAIANVQTGGAKPEPESKIISIHSK